MPTSCAVHLFDCHVTCYVPHELVEIFAALAAVHNAKDIAQGEAKGKNASEAPAHPKEWKGTQVCAKW